MKIKVCGITRLEDAKLAAELGAWAVGFVFVKDSPRYISPRSAAAIIRGLPKDLVKVAVVVNPLPSEVETWMGEGGADVVQFHGEESAALCVRSSRPWIKALRPSSQADLAALENYGGAEYVLIDAAGAKRGGTGRRADWNLAAEVSRRLPGKVILAGGLDAASVADAIREVNPAGLDVSSGLESAPGVKDPEKMRKFFAEVRRSRNGQSR